MMKSERGGAQATGTVKRTATRKQTNKRNSNALGFDAAERSDRLELDVCKGKERRDAGAAAAAPHA